MKLMFWQNNAQTKRVIQYGLMISLALALSVIEKWFPLGLIVPFPGIKLGLANVVTMFALIYFGVRAAFLVTVIRCFLGAIFYGGITALALSLSGGLLALLLMAILKPGYKRLFSLNGISVAGAAAHNVGQVAMAAFLLGNAGVYAYLSVLLLTAVITGVLTGTISIALFGRLEKSGHLQL